MPQPFMPKSHQDAHMACAATPWLSALSLGEARTLPAATEARWLQVESGRLWLTRAGSEGAAAVIWLAAGERWALPPGTAWVMEAWPEAQFAVLMALSASQPAQSRTRVQRLWAAVQSELSTGRGAAPQCRHELHPAAAGTLV